MVYFLLIILVTLGLTAFAYFKLRKLLPQKNRLLIEIAAWSAVVMLLLSLWQYQKHVWTRQTIARYLSNDFAITSEQITILRLNSSFTSETGEASFTLAGPLQPVNSVAPEVSREQWFSCLNLARSYLSGKNGVIETGSKLEATLKGVLGAMFSPEGPESVAISQLTCISGRLHQFSSYILLYDSESSTYYMHWSETLG